MSVNHRVDPFSATLDMMPRDYFKSDALSPNLTPIWMDVQSGL